MELTSEQMQERQRAHTAINRAIQRRFIPRASTLRCAECGEPAFCYHHPNGYDVDHHYDVIPVCRPCHRAAHYGIPRQPEPAVAELAKRLARYRLPDQAAGSEAA